MGVSSFSKACWLLYEEPEETEQVVEDGRSWVWSLVSFCETFLFAARWFGGKEQNFLQYHIVIVLARPTWHMEFAYGASMGRKDAGIVTDQRFRCGRAYSIGSGDWCRKLHGRSYGAISASEYGQSPVLYKKVSSCSWHHTFYYFQDIWKYLMVVVSKIFENI